MKRNLKDYARGHSQRSYLGCVDGWAVKSTRRAENCAVGVNSHISIVSPEFEWSVLPFVGHATGNGKRMHDCLDAELPSVAATEFTLIPGDHGNIGSNVLGGTSQTED